MKVKVISLIVLLLISSFILSACGRFKCELCGEEKSGGKHSENVLGHDLVICDDCYEQLKSFNNNFK